MKLRKITTKIEAGKKTHFVFPTTTDTDAVVVVIKDTTDTTNDPSAEHWVPINADVSERFLKDAHEFVAFAQIINGVIDSEVIIDYAKYAIAYVSNTYGEENE